MSKVIKIKQSDIERIVENIINDNLNPEHSGLSNETNEDELPSNGPKLTVGKGEDGHYYIIDVDSEKIIAQHK
jgi:hypothetical protein